MSSGQTTGINHLFKACRAFLCKLFYCVFKAVFTYIVAFGKIPGAGFFPCIQRFYSRKGTSSSFLAFSPGVFTTIYQDIS
ncbi:hypothetical protein D3H55_18050 [Bacillus salacetis]|uniref:Uncharacterized protein n=1 Tax=Bacillus salacetis TaxID=2315464 RepID=A0A3A1QTN6_9BACI|nr:hypothetical protein D3H55_18050 [Bacillus salacetis]